MIARTKRSGEENFTMEMRERITAKYPKEMGGMIRTITYYAKHLTTFDIHDHI